MTAIADIEKALIEADAAGDAEGASILAHELDQLVRSRMVSRETMDADMRRMADPLSGTNSGQRFMIGMGQAVSQTGRGLKQIGRLGKGLVTGELQQARDKNAEEELERRQLDAPLEGSTAAKLGNFAGNVAMTVPTAFIPGAASVRGASLIGAGLGAAQPVVNDRERLLNMAIGGGLGGIGQFVGQKVAGRIGKGMLHERRGLARAQAQAATEDQTVRQGMAEGFSFSPSSVAPKGWKTAAESVVGKAQFESAAQNLNQPLADAIAKRALGLARSVGFDPKGRVLQRVRDRAYQVFERVKRTGTVEADQTYLDELIDVLGQRDSIAREFRPFAGAAPGAKASDEVAQQIDALFQDRFSAEAAVDYVKRLNDMARSGFAQAKAPGVANRNEILELAHARTKAADALQRLVGRHLTKLGERQLAQQMDDANRMIARSWVVQRATNPGTGHVDVTKIGKALEQGAPLDGDLLLLGRLGSSPLTKNAVKPPSPTGKTSKLAATVVMAGLVTGNPQMALLPAIGLGMRKTLLSRGAQKSMALKSYKPPSRPLARAARGLGRLPLPVAASAYASQE